MHRLIINLSVSILTFVIGTIASLLFYGVSPAPENARGPALDTKDRTAVYESGTFSTGCHHDYMKHETDVRSLPSAPISGGVLNGKAISLPKPEYPAIAKAAHAAGIVTIQVTIDESGNVERARVIGGHPLLQSAAEQAAYRARFTPTLLSGHPVKVTGVITYNFVSQ